MAEMYWPRSRQNRALAFLTLFIVIATLGHPTAARRVPRLLGTSWRAETSYPEQVFEGTGALFRPSNGRGPELMLAGGYLSNSGLQPTVRSYSMTLFTPRARQWSRRADMPMALTHAAQVVVGDTLYTCGGFLGRAPGRSVRECFAYERGANRWRSLPSLPAPRAGGGLVYIGERRALFYASGTDRPFGSFRGRDSATSWMLALGNLRAGWQRKRDLGNARNHMAAVSVSGRHYFLGGQKQDREHSGNQATVEEYDFRRNVWIRRADLPVPLGHIAASTMRYWGGILVVGGIMNGRRVSNRILYYDVSSNSWSVVGNFQRSVQSPVCGVLWRRLFCATGQGGPGNAASVFSREVSVPAMV